MNERGDTPMLLSHVKARHDKMVRLVETTLKLHEDLPKAQTPHKQEPASATSPQPTGRLMRWCMSCTD